MDRIETSKYNSDPDPGWKKVVRKRHRKKKPAANGGVPGKIVPTGRRVLAPIGGVTGEIVPNERRILAPIGGVTGEIVPNERRILAAKMIAADVEDESNGAGAARSKRRPYVFRDEESDYDEIGNEISAKMVGAAMADESNGARPYGFGDNDENGNEIPAKMVFADVANEPARPKTSLCIYVESDSDESDEEEEIAEPVPLLEAASRINNSDFEAFLVDTMETYAASTIPANQLIRFVGYFRRPLRDVRFPWLKMFYESPWPKLIDMIDVPLSEIPEPIYKTSVNWINQVEDIILSATIYWSFDHLLMILSALRKASERPNKFAQPTSPKPEVAILITLAMVLRTRPNALTILSPALRNMCMCEGQHRLPLSVWMMAQASQGDLSIGLYSWARNLLPLVGNTDCGDEHQSTDLILQLVEKIFSDPMAKTILVNGAVREGGERLVPPSSFDILMRHTFPTSSERVEATSRFEAIYPLLKEVALAGAPGSKAMKQLTQEIFTLSLILARQGNPVLAKEAIDIGIWSLTENVDCWKLWGDLYEDNRKASVALLKKLVDEWKDHAFKLSSSPRDILTLNQTINSFRLKNKKGITRGDYVHLYKEADKSCKVISWRLSRVRRCLKGTAITAVVVAVAGAAVAVVLSSNPKLKNLLYSLLLDLYYNAIPILFTCCLLSLIVLVEMKLH